MKPIRQEKFNTVKREIKEVPISWLKSAFFNPSARSNLSSKLLESTERVGGLLELVHVTYDGRIINGHGRVTVCRELGITHVLAAVYTGSEEELNLLYSEMSTTPRPVSGRDQMIIRFLGGPKMHKKTNEAWDILMAYFNKKEFTEETVPSPSFVRKVDELSNVLIGIFGGTKETMFRKVFLHGAEHRLSRIMDEILRLPRSTGRLRIIYNLIKKNKPYNSLGKLAK